MSSISLSVKESPDHYVGDIRLTHRVLLWEAHACKSCRLSLSIMHGVAMQFEGSLSAYKFVTVMLVVLRPLEYNANDQAILLIWLI